MNDLISRQKTIKTIYYYFEDLIKALPKIMDSDGEKIVDISKTDEYLKMYKAIRELIIILPSEQPKIVRCKDCRNRGEAKCPMRHVEMIEWEEDGYIECDDIIHDYTEPHGYCYKGERNE